MLNTRGRSTAALSVVLAAALLTVSCTSSQVLLSLEGVVDATAIATAVLGSLGSSGLLAAPATGATIQYLKASSVAAQNSITEWESSDTTAVKIEKITGFFGGIAAAPLGLSSQLEIVITAVATSITSFLSQLHAGATQAHVLGLSQKTALPLGLTGRYKLHQIAAKARKTSNKLEEIGAN